MRIFCLFIVCFLSVLTSCAHPKAAAVEKQKIKHYALTGTVVSVSPADQTASIDAAAIPNYMGAMTMDYPIKSKAEFQKLHAGDRISATVNADESASYNLTDIKITGHGVAGKK